MGAIYESLLALRLTRAPEDLVYDSKREIFRPRRADDKGEPEVTKAQLYYQSEAGGRKAGGVFYTRHEFVEHLLNHALLPALDDHLEEIKRIAANNPKEAARRLFDFSVVDPAMGSAHFLTAALDMMADRIETFLGEVGGLPGIAQQLSELTHDNAPSTNPPDAADLLRRLILKRCIYGVDISPMAVEVANVTLWLASFVPGLALSYLGSNLKCGDALIGVADPHVVGASDSPLLTGQPVEAAMRRAAELQRQLARRARPHPRGGEALGRTERRPCRRNRGASERLQPCGRRNLSGWRALAIRWRTTQQPSWVGASRARLSRPLTVRGASPTATASSTGRWSSRACFTASAQGLMLWSGTRRGIRSNSRCRVSWPCTILGIRGLSSGIERDKRAEKLFKDKPWLGQEVEDIQEQVEEQRKFFRPENGYSLQGSGDTDLYKLFCERYASIAGREGFMGVVLPRVAFLNDGSRGFRRWFFKDCRPSRIDAILNSGRWAFDMEPRYTVALTAAQVGVSVEGTVTVTGPARNEREFAEYVSGEGVLVELATLASWSPAPADDPIKEPSWELPLLPTRDHVSVLSKLRRGIRFDFLQKPQNHKNRKGGAAVPRAILYRELDAAQQRHLFNNPTGSGRISVWKGSSFDQYDPYAPDHPQGKEVAGYGNPQEIEEFLQAKRGRSREFKGFLPKDVLADPSTLPFHHARIAFRAISRATDSRTVISCLVPPKTPLTDRAPFVAFHLWGCLEQAFILGVFNSIPFDWQARRSVETTMNYFILNSLAFPPLDNTPWERIGNLAARLSCVDERFAEFAADCGECGMRGTDPCAAQGYAGGD